jgi:glycogen debranching enzyme
MWLWDSVFHSFGLRWLDENLAARAVEAVLEQQREDGFIPHMMTPTEHSDITQPPLLAWAIHESYSRTGDKDFIRRNLPRLRAYLEWDLKNRDTNHNLLCEWFIEGDPRCRSGESGMDNSQRFDKAALMDAVDFSCFMKNEYDCMAAMAAALDLGGEAEAYRKTATQIAEGVNKFLWNEKLGFYTDRYMDGTLSDVMAVSGFLPLWAGIAGPEQAKKLAAHLLDPKTFGTALPVPSASAADPEYSTDMWRGSVWLNFNYMVILGLKRYGMETLARDLAKKSVDAIARWYGQCGAIYEYYHAENLYPPQSLDRKGATTPPVDIRRKIFPIADYGWTAAVYIALLQQGYYLD